MSKTKKNQLGQGLRALLSSMDSEESVIENQQDIVKEIAKSIGDIPLDQIEINPYQPRTEFDQEALQELSDSIRNYGLIQPITIRRIGPDAYQLISGERRYRASKMAGLESVPAYIRIVNDNELLELALVENIQRRDLNAVEVGLSYQRLLDEFNYTHDQLAARVGKKRSTVTNYVRLLKLPPQIQAGLKSQEISMGHARSLINVDNITDQLYIFQRIMDEGLSVRATEKIVGKLKEPIVENESTSLEESDQTTDKLTKYADRISLIVGSKVNIKTNKQYKGQFEIKFSNKDELNRLINLFEDL